MIILCKMSWISFAVEFSYDSERLDWTRHCRVGNNHFAALLDSHRSIWQRGAAGGSDVYYERFSPSLGWRNRAQPAMPFPRSRSLPQTDLSRVRNWN